MVVLVVFFLFKQKTAYEMRISDWSSDVCSSDLSIVTLKIVHGHVVQVNVLAGGDIARGKTDDLVVAMHGRAVRDVVYCDLVARRNGVGRYELFARYGSTGLDVASCDQNIVVRAEPYCHMPGIRPADGVGWHRDFLHHIVSCLFYGSGPERPLAAFSRQCKNSLLHKIKQVKW